MSSPRPPSRLEAGLASGRFVVTSELNPPKGIDLEPLLASAALLAGVVEAINITDSHTARMSMAPIAAAHLLLDHDVEPIVQMTTRDRNRIALQGDMLAAAALGVRNLVLMGGDSPATGDHPEAMPVFDIGTEALIALAHGLAEGRDGAGNALRGTPALHIGAVVNPGASDLGKEIARMEEKVRAGARFFQTQAVYDPAAFERFARRAEPLGMPVLAGIIPLKSVRMAEHLNANVPGIAIPPGLIERIGRAGDVEQASCQIAAATIRALRPMCQGCHIMAIGWERLVRRIVDAAG